MDKEKIDQQGVAGLSLHNVFVFLALISLVVAIALYGISLTKKYQLSSAEKKLADANDELRSMKDADEKAMVAAAAVENYDSLNAEKNYWSTFLAEMASKTLVNVKLNELSMTEEGGVMNIDGMAKTYEDLSKFIVSLRSSSKIEGVTLLSANLESSASAGGVSFSLEAIPAGGAFAPASAEVND